MKIDKFVNYAFGTCATIIGILVWTGVTSPDPLLVGLVFIIAGVTSIAEGVKSK